MQVTREQSKKSNKSISGKSSSSSGSKMVSSPTTKSVAQRVMDVAANNGDPPESAPTNSKVLNNNKESSNCQELTKQANQMETTNIAEETNINSSPNRDQNNSNDTNKISPPSSPTQVASSSRSHFDNSIQLDSSGPNLIDSDSVFNQILAKDFHSEPTSKGDLPITKDQSSSSDMKMSRKTNGGSESCISLDSKLLNPVKANQFEAKKFESSKKDSNIEEEVSYYNDDAINDIKSCRRMDAANKLSVMVNHRAQEKQNCYSNDNHDYNTSEPLYDTNYDVAACYVDSADINANSRANSDPESPKAKSAPATPCNVTPTAFHQHTSHFNAMLNPSPANTLPTDIWKNLSNTCRVVMPGALPMGAQSQAGSLQYLEDLIRRGESLLEAENYKEAIKYFTQWENFATNNQNINYLKKYFKVFSQRAEAHFNLGNYKESIEDSMSARELNPKWVPAYYREGRAQLILGQHVASLAVFAFGLTQEPNNKRLLEALVDAALKSPFKAEFELKLQKLKSLHIDKNSFIVVSVLGQELLNNGFAEHSIIMLESALKMGVDSKKLKGSVCSSIAHGYYLKRDYEKAVSFMEKELDIESELEDVEGQCRVLNNLGLTYYKLRKFDLSIQMHRKQIDLAMKTSLFRQVCLALNALGHIHSTLGNFNAALTSHSRCLELMKELGENNYSQFKETLAIGYINSMMGDLKGAECKYNDAYYMLQCRGSKLSDEECQTGQIMLKFNLAMLAIKRQSFSNAKQCYDDVIQLARQMSSPKGPLYEMRASMGLGHACRLFKRFDEAQLWFEKQLELAKSLKDRSGISQALTNLGMTYQYFKDYPNALKLFEDNLALVSDDPMMKAYAHSYLASMACSINNYNEAHDHYEKSLNIFKGLDNCIAERKTIDLNLAAVRERMGHSEPFASTTHATGQQQQQQQQQGTKKVLMA